MSGDTPTLTSEIARVVRLGSTADEYADARNEPDAVSDAAGDLGDALRQLGGSLRRLDDEHRAEVERLRAEVERLTVALAEERVAKDEARRNLCRKVVMTARDLPVRVRREDATDAMCSDSAEVADAWGWGYLYPEATP